MEIFCERLKKMRNGQSYQAFAKTTGLPASSLERWEKGLSDIKASQLRILAKVLSVSADWLLGIDDPMRFKEKGKENEASVCCWSRRCSVFTEDVA